MSDSLKTIDDVLENFMVIAHGNLQAGDRDEANKCLIVAKSQLETIMAAERLDELEQSPTRGYDEKMSPMHQFGSQYIEDRQWELEQLITPKEDNA